MTLFLVLVILATLLAMAAWWYYRGRHMGAFVPTVGAAPAILDAKPQGTVLMLKMPIAKGWELGKIPDMAAGLQVGPLALNLKHSRWAYVLPNGDVLVAESAGIPGTPKIFATSR
ncbi:MAG: hypothetical protein MO846_11485 [Candidatus Devosia symbiotica]|nr:hypothetical protein [Candidatus Devosia symbiotica]